MQKGKQSISQSGFTLIEILVAVTILGLAYVAILQNFSVSLRNLARLDGKRLAIFDEALVFEQRIKFVSSDAVLAEGAEAKKEAEVEESGPTFLEGQKYRLVTVTSENGEFMTFMLETL
ncbi:MAG: hypothetical protein A2511_04860 [Deltaproteobacteria bacterium RIFOXYD12_FULL_50_9]|nr:MAG: hypothetical protein A2511_04860 [Deltaproteobacteria bacterium RIFOXYD12_FULL_50_9]